MKLDKKNVLILGLGVSGVSTAKALSKLGAEIYITDQKNADDLNDYVSQIKDLNAQLYLGTNDVPLDDIDLVVKSPGVPLTLDIIRKARDKDIEVITDLELAYRTSPDKNYIAITGTNGKTTTTTLTGELFKQAGFSTHVSGNIGVGILWDILNSKKDDIFVIEASSFQLESTKKFTPNVSVILNITPDHLNWHGSFENYVEAKKKIFKNQTKSDYAILNYDDLLIRGLKEEVKANIFWFSVENKLSRGAYIDDQYIVINDGNNVNKVVKIEDLKILGKHNLENVLASVSIGWIMGLNLDIVKNVLESFRGVEHRIEYVTTIDGIGFYNDSKGTNPDASIKAVEAVNDPIILIAGGLDKGIEFNDFIKAFNGKVKYMMLLGETKEKIKETAIKCGFTNIYIVDSMKEAVNKSFEIAEKGDNILLSPACASWDMYSSFEKRGYDFKKAVNSLKEE
ncbi:UDP-N-acetylmuramoyl-L-alanine--D-glutamate ligase [Schnuerera sp. xch1]|uniref:UDP-N-acetylmuramoyl-L-alanine--D-glutamate ligase n=1 Tax=Schnuerera sp. xch1 TaxID=2874283 RepID=UPI001CBB137E|nr:UDP-N-acetylmuramoyl-L-alanine--D-glutamate ligase [Schnuerera sp. xch1]MBZ2173673.1 UDP-N-acetylmuramoyl-L-alanine--D-glutamate ligase [Schnuerera sp. xch1]